MGETSDSESSDNIILLPWYSTPNSRGEESSSSYVEKLSLPWYSSPANRGQESGSGYEASTSANPRTNMISQFVGMGFPERIVRKAIEENGESNTELLLETLLTYSALNKSPSERGSKSEQDVYDDFSNFDSNLENEGNAEDIPEKDKKLLYLIDMGFPAGEASSAIDASGPDTSIAELMDFICAAQTEKTDDAPLQEPPEPSFYNEMGPNDYHRCPTAKKRKKLSEAEERWKGVPNDPRPVFPRKIPEEAVRHPFYYYENTTCTRGGVWSTVSRLYEVEPEFVDSLNFSPAAREGWFVHNLPTHNRYCLLPIPPLTIQEALPLTKKWWPSWDKRTKLNCLNTSKANAKVIQRVRDALERCDGIPPLNTQKIALDECTKWNLVWVGKNKVAPLEPDEIEMLLGYPKNHTRGGGISMTERYKVLCNSLQVDTIAYHFSVLKKIFPNGVNVLSIFSGIGGALVALDRLHIQLNNVVYVETSEINRNIIRSWWEQTNQKGNMIELDGLQQLTQDRLEHLFLSVGGFDMIVGESPGSESVHFDNYFQVLNIIRCMQNPNPNKP